MQRNRVYLLGILALVFGMLGSSWIHAPLSESTTPIEFVEQYDLPLPRSSSQSIPMIPATNLTGNYRDLNPEFASVATNFLTAYKNNLTRDTRTPSIFSTWLAVETLGKVNYASLMDPTIRDPTIQYLLSTLNGSMIFHENLNYTMYMNVSDNNEDKFIFAPYTPTVIHQTALIALGKLNTLSEWFSQGQLTAWKSEILANNHADGGFGTRIKNEEIQSTLVETYFAVACLQELNRALNEVISTPYIVKIQTFVENHQSIFTEMPNPVPGCFYEYSEYKSRGWLDFQIDWMACQILEMIQADITGFKTDFLNFLTTWEIYLPQDQCFVPTFNDRGSAGKYFYSGTYLIGDCIRILDLDAEYPIIAIQAKVLDQFAKGSYFQGINISTERDLSIQFFGAHYLNTTGLITTLSETNRTLLTAYVKDYFTSNGGASFQNNRDLSLTTKATVFSFANQFGSLSAGDKATLYWSLNAHRTWKISGTYYYFSDNDFNGTQWRRNFAHYDTLWNDYVEATYSAIATLQQLGLLATFYTIQGWQAYLNFEAWPKTQLLADGSFRNDSRYSQGDLEATFQALETQRILIAFNTGQTFETYYSAQEFTLIRDYVLQYVCSNTTHWWAQAPGLTVNQATNYAYGILSIVSPSSIDPTKITTFVQDQIEGEIAQDPALMVLVQRLQTSLIERGVRIVPNHTTIANQLESLNSPFSTRLSPATMMFMQFTYMVTPLRLYIMYVDSPVTHALYTTKPYSVVVCNWITAISLSDLVLTGAYGTAFRTWTYTAGVYSALICPEYSPTNVTAWGWSLDFRINAVNYQITGQTIITYTFEVQCNLTPTSMILKILASGSILDRISASATFSTNTTKLEVPTQIIRQDNTIIVTETLPAMPNETVGELSVRIWNAPNMYWNDTQDQNAIQYSATLLLPKVTSNQTSSPSNPTPSNGSSVVTPNPFEFDGPTATVFFTAMGGCSVGATVFVRNVKTLRTLKKKK